MSKPVVFLLGELTVVALALLGRVATTRILGRKVPVL